ncbi:MAG: hypothetical protein K5799_13645 [Erythrobacter sp.]|nr:hypothetical protein [Erythrobacter sp.]
MADKDDLRGMIPDSPPPNGDRRSEAIEAALRRFDARVGGGEESAPEKAPPRRQLAVLASALLVLLVTVPILVTQGDRLGRVDVPAEPESEPPPTTNRPLKTLPRSESRSVSPVGREAAAGSPTPTPRGDVSRNVSQAPASAATVGGREPGLRDAVPAVSSESSAAPERRGAEASNAPAAAPKTFALPPPPPPLPPPPPPPARVAQATSLAEADDAADNIVVTGSRIVASQAETVANRLPRVRPSSRQLSRWRSCTLIDPRKDATRCGEHRAAGSAQLVRGLDLAFRQDDSAALKAFDSAIAQAPQAIGGYLNRSLLLQRKGDRDAALADLDAAIRVAPGDARGYYFRSLLLREAGDADAADRDLQTASSLDNR